MTGHLHSNFIATEHIKKKNFCNTWLCHWTTSIPFNIQLSAVTLPLSWSVFSTITAKTLPGNGSASLLSDFVSRVVCSSSHAEYPLQVSFDFQYLKMMCQDNKQQFNMQIIDQLKRNKLPYHNPCMWKLEAFRPAQILLQGRRVSFEQFWREWWNKRRVASLANK